VNVLVLGGTSEARQLAELLAGAPDTSVVVSLAGHTTDPAPLPCRVRTGGFGGVDGLVAHLRATAVDVLVDATHPFSATMPANAARASALAGIPSLRLIRPAWERRRGDRWTDAADLHEVRRLLVERDARRVLLTTGRLDLAPFASLRDMHFVVRTVEAPGPMPLNDATVIRARGPFDVASEVALLRDHHIDTLVTKNAGGPDAKLVAARRTGVAVLMVRRPPVGSGAQAANALEARAWLEQQRDHILASRRARSP
jgi:precorrin-6A/cobalt-precorrin-6A reductase